MGNLTTLLFPLLILLLFIPIFLSGRKQKRQMAEMQSLQSSLEPGDIIMTTSGLRATVVDASYEETIDLEIADGVITTWVRAAVQEDDAEPETDVVPGTVVDAPHEAVADDGKAPDARLSLEKDDSTNGTPRI
jgi:preprotein translocase subunit YajC